MNNQTIDENIEELLNILDNENYDNIVKYTNASIKKQKNKILQELGLNRSLLKQMHSKLEEYRYICDLSDLRYGSYIRWIPLKNEDNIYLTNGGIVIDIKILDCIHIVCKNNRNFIIQFKFDEALIFQKISDQEYVILNILDYLKKNNIQLNDDK